MADANQDSREALTERVRQLTWVHRIDLGHGLVTPGLRNPNHPVVMKALDDIDFRGKKVLDIGCWDGLWSFEAEKRGAAVVHATDLVSQRDFHGQPTFRLAHEILRSRVQYTPDLSVYDVERLGVRDFDVVIYAGVYYHLKDPLRSFAALRGVMSAGGVLLTEGAVLNEEGCFARYYYRDKFMGDHSNWWVPTVSCLKQWIESNFFEEMRDYEVWNAGGGNLRSTILARSVRRADPLYIRPDDPLKAFDLNDYAEEGSPASAAVPAPSRRSLPSRVLRALRGSR